MVATTRSLFQHPSNRGRKKDIICLIEIRETCTDLVASYTETLSLEGELPVTKWEEFKTLTKTQLYTIRYVENQWIWWHYFKQKPSQRMQNYTTKFRKMAIMLGISPKNPYVFLKYLRGLHEQVMLFKSKSMDKACV